MLKSEMECWNWVEFSPTKLTGVVKDLWKEECLPTRNGEDWKGAFSHVYEAYELFNVAAEIIAYAESVGARMVGFSPTPNPHFRGRKFRPLGFPSPSLYLLRSDGAGDPKWPFIRLFAEHLVRVGRVALCNWIYAPQKPLDYGTREQVAETFSLYPNLFGKGFSLPTRDPDQFDLLRKEYLP